MLARPKLRREPATSRMFLDGPTGQGFVAAAKSRAQARIRLSGRMLGRAWSRLLHRGPIMPAISDLALAGSLLRVTLRVTLT